jgi:uncharacterized protein YabN with tetrapyrrole methylase and pyrophosphatase domain
VDDKQCDALSRVMDLVRYLRTHCPWDAAQTPRSLIPYLLEEAHETADAIADRDEAALRSELGDLLLNVAFQLVLAEERQAFETDQVADTVIEKMRRRHPHLFGLGEREDWETLKARERDDRAGLLHGVARGLDPLSRAHRIQDRVAAVGFDWEDATGAFDKVMEELEEVRAALENVRGRPAISQRSPVHDRPPPGAADHDEPVRGEPVREEHPEEPLTMRSPPDPSREASLEDTPPEHRALEEELGDLLFAVVNLTRLAGAHALTALHGANAKFSRRFQGLERLAARRGIDLGQAGLDELEALWTEVKRAED